MMTSSLARISSSVLLLSAMAACGGGGGGTTAEPVLAIQPAPPAPAPPAPPDPPAPPTALPPVPPVPPPSALLEPWTKYVGAHYTNTPDSGLTRAWAGGGLRDPGGSYRPVLSGDTYLDDGYAIFTSRALPLINTLLGDGKQAVLLIGGGSTTGASVFLNSRPCKTSATRMNASFLG